METFEEVSEAFKKFKEGIIARAYSISCLRSSNIGPTQPKNKEGTHSEENVDTDDD